MTRLSARNNRASRNGLAPSAVRVATSLNRSVILARNRLVRFAHASARTTATAPNRNNRSRRTVAGTMASLSATTRAPRLVAASDGEAVRRLAMPFSSASAAAIVAFGFSRATTWPMRTLGCDGGRAMVHRSLRASGAAPGRIEAAPYGN
jgi:hypothetical protein